VTVHNYGTFYDRLWQDLRPHSVVEIGVFNGASLRAWQDVTPGGRIIGADRNPVPGLDVVRMTSPEFGPLRDRLRAEQPVDLIIDDGSHTLPDQVAGVRALWPYLRDGGVYAVEDLQDESAVDWFRGQGWTIEDFRGVSGRYDDLIAWRRKQAGE
jgi:cephalosporin hydroxylase